VRNDRDNAPVADRPSFDARVAPHLPKLYRLAYRLTGSVADAEDLLQDVIVKVYERQAELAGIEALFPWAARVLHNLFIDRVRYYARRRLTSIGAAESERGAVEAALGHAPPADDVVAAGFDIKTVAAAVAKLALEQRTVLLMHDAEGYQLHEIQEVTGVPLGTLKSRLHRARQRLRELLAVDGTFGSP
jgi:RNA polymerase sigma-70 factor (ECF subfamily)